MGVGPSKEKLLELIKKSSKSNVTENNYKLDFQIGQDNEICGGDEELLDNENIEWGNPSSNSLFHSIKDEKRFPYVAMGTITFKFPGNENFEHTCFAINKKVLITHSSFLKNNKKNATEITTTLTSEKLNMKSCANYERKNLAIFFLEETHVNQWIGVDEFIHQKKNNDKKNKNNQGHLKVVFSTGKGTKADLDRSDSVAFQDERSSSLEGASSKLIPFLQEFNYDDENKMKIVDAKDSLKKQMMGGVLYYKNSKSGGVYAIGILDKNCQPSFFDHETLKYLYEQVNKAKLSTTEGIDESNIIELDLSKKSIGPSHIKILTEFNLCNLKKLNLLKNQIGPQGAFYLGQSKFSNLEILILNFNEIGDEGIQYLSKGPFLGLKYLYLFHNNISNIGVEYILDSIFIDTLLLLDLSDNPNINVDGIGILKNRIQENNNVLKELLCLNLSATSLNDMALEKINEIQFPKLKRLIMQDIDFSKCKKLIDLLKAKRYEVKIDGII
jgi:hypothetical protein